MNKENKKPVVVFDLDGTLLDSIADISESANRALTLSSLSTHTMAAYRTFVGWGAETLIRKAIHPITDEAVYRTVRTDYDRIYQELCNAGGRLFEGVAPLLEELHSMGVLLAVCSNKPQPQTEAVCKSSFGALLDGYAGQLPDVPIKPDPAGVLLLMERMGGIPIAYVGDSDVDIHTGNNLGCPTIGVSWGMQPKEQLIAAGADVIADSI
ncbi:MAG: HAD hydrolase-like protein, partial [Angelakisella sp.]